MSASATASMALSTPPSAVSSTSRALQEQVSLELPRVPDATVHLDARPSRPVGGVRRHQPGARHGASRSGVLVDEHGRVVHGSAGCLHRHRGVGELVLDGLERADGAAELLPLLGVAHAEVERGLAQADLQTPPPAGCRLGGPPAPSSTAVPPPSSSTTDTGVSGSIGRGTGVPSGKASSSRICVPCIDEQHIDLVEVLDQRGRCERREADDGLAAGSAVDHTGRQERRHHRAGHSGAAQLLEHHHGFGPAESYAPIRLGERQREDTHRAELSPEVAVDAPPCATPA